MKLAHAMNHCLSAVGISPYLESGILFSQFVECKRKLVDICLGLRFYSNPDNGFREIHCLEDNWFMNCTYCIASFQILESDTGTDITSSNAVFRILLVCMHLKEAVYTFPLAGTCIQHC